MHLVDAHNHLHQAAFDGRRGEAWAAARAAGVGAAVVNGTHPDDWDAVAELCAPDPGLHPAYGVHPWRVNGLPADWLGGLRERLLGDPAAGLGEVGLDCWVEGHDLAVQIPILTAQWQLGRELDRPATIHVLKAWDAWMAFLREHPEPVRPFLLHAFGGPVEIVPELVRRGAMFSFSPSFCGSSRRRKQRPFMEAIPLDRLLIETDAPSMPPPPELDAFGWTDPAGRRVHHPAGLTVALDTLAELRGIAPSELAAILQANFRRWWGG